MHKKLFEDASIAIFVADATTGIIVDCNSVAARLVERDRAELIGKHQRILHPVEEHEGDLSRTFREHLKGPDGKPLEAKIITRKGEIKDVEIKTSIFEVDGKNLIQGVFSDISKRKQMEEKLRQSEEKFRSIFNSSNDAIMLVDGDRFIDCNYATLKVFACESKEEFCRQKLLDLSPPKQADGRESGQVAGERIATAFRDGHNFFEWIHRRANGEDFPAEVLLTPVILEGEKILQGSVRDISERKRLEEALRKAHDELEVRVKERTFQLEGSNAELEKEITVRKQAEKEVAESEELHRLTLGNISDAVFITDDSGKFSFICPNVNVIFGYSFDEVDKFDNIDVLLGNNLFELRKLKKMREIPNIERTVVDKTGRVHALLVSVKAVAIKGGTVLYTCRDITERKQAEEGLKESQKMLKLVLDTIPVRVFWKDLDSQYLGCNKLFAQDAGLDKPEQILGKNDFELGWSEQAELYRDDDREVMRSKKDKLNYEEPQTTSNGDKIWRQTSKTPLLDIKGDVIGLLGTYENITARKHVEENLRKLSQAVEQSPVSILITDTQGNIEYVNPKFTKLTGYTFDEAMGQNPRLLKSGEQEHAFYKKLWDTIISGKVWRGEFHNKKKNGELYWEAASISPVKSDEGIITHFIAVKEDITERKQTEDAIQTLFESMAGNVGQEFFENLVNSLRKWLKTDCVIIGEVADEDNVEALAMVMDGEIIPQFSYALHSTPCENVTEKGFCIYPESIIELFPEDKDLVDMGAEGYVGTPLKDKNGNAVGILCAISHRKLDLPPRTEEIMEIMAARITVEIERKRAEDRLSKGEQKFRGLSQQFHALLDAIPDSLILLSSDLTVQWANKNCFFKSGVCDESSIGQKCHQLWQSLSQPCDGCPTTKSFESGSAESSQITLADGKIWAVRAFPIADDTGKVVNVIELATDITRKLRRQEETMRAGQLASIGELAAGVAHEINNPINSMINLSQLLANESARGNESYDICNRIISEGKRISVIVKGLLSFAHENGGGKEAVNIENVLSDCLLLTESQMKKDNICLKVNIPSDLPSVIANYQRLQQVFLNIINNARYALNEKYPGHDENKIFEISAKEVGIDERPYLRVTFHDRGEGIPSGIKDKLVEPFFSTKPQHQGTGLGLSISLGIIKNHDGKITFDSIEGEFTKVIVELPALKRENS